MVTPMIAKADPRAELLALTSDGAPVALTSGYAAPDALPTRDDLAETVIRLGQPSVWKGVVARGVDQGGNIQPGRALSCLQKYSLAGDGLLAFKGADGRVVERATGVPLRIKPYRMLWGERDNRLLPLCASTDHILGRGNPGGECDVCPFTTYQGRGAPYCRSKSRLYMVGKGRDEPAIFDLTAMTREGLQSLDEWCRLYQVPPHRTVITLSLETHPRQMGDYKSTLLKVELVGLLPDTPDLGAAADYANYCLERMEEAWAMDIGDRSKSGAPSVVDSTRGRPTATLSPPRPLPELPAPTPETATLTADPETGAPVAVADDRGYEEPFLPEGDLYALADNDDDPDMGF